MEIFSFSRYIAIFTPLPRITAPFKFISVAHLQKILMISFGKLARFDKNIAKINKREEERGNGKWERGWKR